MDKTKYHLHLKGYVGGWDFDRSYVDYILEKHQNEEVHVLIDSLGGRADTALSIYASFKRHGNVHVHFVGMNASAATIASLGAKHISMDRSSMYLVHKCSVDFFKWASLNSEGLQQLIEKIEQQKADLEKMDANVAEMYARKCKKSAEDLLELMKKGGWLNSKETLEWGFVDEVTELEEDEAPVLDSGTVQAMADAGIPLPKGFNKESAMKRFLASMAEIFSGKEPKEDNNTFVIMDKKFLNVGEILKCDTLSVNEGCVSLQESQMDAIEAAITADKTTISELTENKTSMEAEIANLKAQVESLKAKPAESSQQVVTTNEGKEAPNDIEAFVASVNSARELYDMFD